MSETFGDRYVLESGRSGHDRLRMLCDIHDRPTRELQLRAGLGPGRRYGEFGCGLGYVARWAASQGAQVTAVDLSAEHLGEARQLADEAGLTDIRWINASIYDHGLPDASLDHAYIRWLLVHLNRPVDALSAVFGALKPGGVLVCEEPDLSAIYCEPPSEAYQLFRDAVLAAGEARGVDYAGGRRLHRWLLDAGFQLEHAAAYQPHYLEGPRKGFWSWSFIEAAPGLIADGILTGEQVEALAHGMRAADEATGVLVGHCRNHQVIARKP